MSIKIKLINKPCKYFNGNDGFCLLKDLNQCNPINCQFYETTDEEIIKALQEQLLAEQAKNKKLVEALEKIAYRDITIKSNFYSSTVANQALNEVNNAK